MNRVKKYNKKIKILIQRNRTVLVTSFGVLLGVAFTTYSGRFHKDNTINIFLCFVISVAILVLIMGPIIVTQINNFKSCGVEEFDDLDKKINEQKKSDNGYLFMVQWINIYYRKGGIVDRMLANNQISKVFLRKDFLEKSLNQYNDFYTIITSFGVSSITTVLFNAFFEEANMMVSMLAIVIYILGMLILVFLRHIHRGELGSLKRNITELELQYLEEKLYDYYRYQELTYLEEVLLRTKSDSLAKLIQKRKKTKVRKQKVEIKKDIDILRDIQLPEEYSLLLELISRNDIN